MEILEEMSPECQPSNPIAYINSHMALWLTMGEGISIGEGRAGRWLTGRVLPEASPERMLEYARWIDKALPSPTEP